MPQQATINPNNTQQTQEPIITPFTIPKNNQSENTGTANSGISGSTVDIPQNNESGSIVSNKDNDVNDNVDGGDGDGDRGGDDNGGGGGGSN